MNNWIVSHSPCPNDLFIFYPWTAGLTAFERPQKTEYADIQTLNEMALQGTFDIGKISFSILPEICSEYCLLPVGSALGFGCGPKIISKKKLSLKQISELVIAIPGEKTTAHLLLQRLLPSPAKKLFCSYDQICTLIDQGIVDCGLIIHETRFTFERAGFLEVADLGLLWQEKMQLPLPLGGLVAKRSLGKSHLAAITAALKESIEWSYDHRDEIGTICQRYSQEKDLSVIQSHIDLYVNEESQRLSKQGLVAIQTLLDCQQEAIL